MSNRNYNIFFHLHTVSGITVSVLLFVIFFAGAFTLFREEINSWESNEPVSTGKRSSSVDCDKVLEAIAVKKASLYGRTIYLTPGEKSVSIYLTPSADTTAKGAALKELELSYDKSTGKLKDQNDSFGTGTLLYWLHFYWQFGNPGYYLAGFVALIFFLAIVTGVLVHWKKIRSNFFVFRPKTKWKTIWTDAHTALGTIGLPFQFLYALTGAMFGLGVLVSASGAAVLYNNDVDKVYELLYEQDNDSLGMRSPKIPKFNALVEKAGKRWPGFTTTRLTITNYGSSTMKLSVGGEVHPREQFLGNGEIVFDMHSKKIVKERDPLEPTYTNGVWDSVFRLHYANYGKIGSLGNYLLKTAYFLLAFLTCFVIISGVMIWLEARNKKNIPDKRRRYNERVGAIYLAVCLTMFPVTALAMLVAKLLPGSVNESREMILNWTFFGGWLLLSVVFSLWKNNQLTNKFSLFTGGILGAFIPLVNGWLSGNWFWKTFGEGEYGLFSVDVLWIILSFSALFAWNKLRRIPKTAVNNSSKEP